MSLQAAIVRWAIRKKLRRSWPERDNLFGVTGLSNIGAMACVEPVRRALDATAMTFPGPMRGTTVDRTDAGVVHGEWIAAPEIPRDTKRVILYCHGGGYFWGNLRVPRNMLARLSKLAQARVFSLDYRLAPEAPFPAALDDAEAAFRWLIEERAIDPEHIIVGGESAGGGLALSLLLRLIKRDAQLPAGAVLFSPWTDLTMSGVSVAANAATDPVLSRTELFWAAEVYLNGADAQDALVSPLFASMEHLPPILLQVGSTEMLLDDSKRFADAVMAAGGRCTLEVWPKMHHTWQLHSYFLPEGRQALNSVAAFIEDALPPVGQ